MVKRNIVALIGCGKSVLQLGKEEKEFLNSLEYSYGINMFCAFGAKIDLYPKYVWFTDTLDPSSQLLKKVIEKALKNKNTPKAFVLPKSMIIPFDSNKRLGFVGSFFPWRDKAWTFHPKKTSYCLHLLLKKTVITKYIYRMTEPFYLPEFIQQIFIMRNNSHENKGGKWAETLCEELFSFQTSLTSIFNYLYLLHPNTDILMSGVDLNSGGSFYDDYPDAKKIDERNHLSDVIEREQKHISLINYNGQGTILDVMDFIVEKLKSRNIRLVSINPNSELVIRGWASVWDK
jgi:hypothetical protein